MKNASPEQLVPPDIRGLIFDCDGTIADTMPLHFRAWVAALGAHQCEFPEALFYEWAGMPSHDIIRTLNERHGHSMPVEETAARKQQIFEELMPQSVKPIKPVLQIVEHFAGEMPMAVATGNPRALCEKTLRALGILELFEAIVGSDDVLHGKPAPDIFLDAAKRINVSPGECMAFEDGELGLQSARAAGMRVLDIRQLL